MLGSDVGNRTSGPFVSRSGREALRSRSWVGLVLVLLGTAATYGSARAGAGDRATATFAGGCFWCMEAPFAGLRGVSSVTSGYAGGHKRSPTYDEVSAGTTGPAGAGQGIYDPAEIGYQRPPAGVWAKIHPPGRDRPVWGPRSP